MTISELNNILTALAKSSYLVNEAFTGDVYNIDFKENKFGCFVATPMTGVKNDGTITYNYTLYYVDRLTKSEDNIDFVQSDAVRVLKGVINFLEEHSIEVEDGYQITLFRHQFDDWCAGAYVEVNLTIPDGDCDEEFNLSGELRHLIADRNGIYTPDNFDGYDRVVIDVPQTGATEEWVDEEIDRKLEDYASLEWVQAQGYLTQHQELKTINGKSILGSGNIDIDNREYIDITKVEPYLYDVKYDFIDYEYAKDYFEHRRMNLGSCTAVSRDNLVGRNYDWWYDNEAGFVIRTNNVIGVGGSVSALTESLVNSGVYNIGYKILPFVLQDGINRDGLFAEINVVPVKNGFPSVPTVEKRESISNVMLVRYILDKFNSVDSAVDYIKKYVEVYNSLEGQETHYLLKDSTKTVALEFTQNGVKVVDTDVLTNFHIYNVILNVDGTVNTPETANYGQYPSANNIEKYGQGLERWNLVKTYVGSLDEMMKDLYYSNAYKGNGWYSEFVGGDIIVETPSLDEDFQARIAEYEQKWEDRDRNNPEVWHTVHSSIYNIDDRSLKLTSQEGENVYTFYLYNTGDYATVDYVDGVKDELLEYVDEGLEEKADQEYVESEISRVESNIPSTNTFATKNWVNSRGFAKEADIEDLATKSWVRLQKYLVCDDLEGYATESWIRSQEFLVLNDLIGYATKEWVRAQNYLVEDDLCGYATEEWVRNWVDAQEFVHQCDLIPYATKTWVENQGYIDEEELDEILEFYATIEYVDNEVERIDETITIIQNDITTIQSDIATIQSDITAINTSISTIESDIATIQSDIERIDEELSSDYATKTWVEEQGYLDEETDPIFSASPAHTITTSNISSWNGKFDASLVWSGSSDEWDALTSAEKASYTIALITA